MVRLVEAEHIGTVHTRIYLIPAVPPAVVAHRHVFAVRVADRAGTPVVKP